MTSVDTSEVMRALEFVHREEITELQVTIMRYRALLEEHGIEPPDDAGRDALKLWRDCQGVIDTAHRFVTQTEHFRETLGTSKELLAESWR